MLQKKQNRMIGTWRWGIWQGGETHTWGINSAPIKRKTLKKDEKSAQWNKPNGIMTNGT
jgi:hypothetical protein